MLFCESVDCHQNLETAATITRRFKMKEFLKKITEIIVPERYQLALRFFYLEKRNKLDDEMFYVAKLLNKKRRFLDIGANVGIYSYYFNNTFEKIDAFYPKYHKERVQGRI